MLISSEEPQYLFDGDEEDVSLADPEWSAQHPKAHYLVRRRQRFSIPFSTFSDGNPAHPEQMLQQIVDAANSEMPSGYRLQKDEEFFSFVATKTRNAQGMVVESTPLLDRRVSIPPGTRTLAESGRLLADALSAQTGLKVSCCQTLVAGIPWGMAEAPFEAHDEMARSVLERLIRLDLQSPNGKLVHWLVRCDAGFCFIDLQGLWGGSCIHTTIWPETAAAKAAFRREAVSQR
jgi:hypothetical protein